jgi:hypothetical protein
MMLLLKLAGGAAGIVIAVAGPAAGGTTLTVIERGDVYNPVFRFVSRYVIGHTRTLDAYFANVRKAAETVRSAKA